MAKQLKFEVLATDYWIAHGGSWSAQWRKGWMRKLELYAFPHIGKLAAEQIDTAHILKVLQPIWATKTRTADEVRGQIEQILDAAKARGLREGLGQRQGGRGQRLRRGRQAPPQDQGRRGRRPVRR